MPRSPTNYGERMARIETTLDHVKTDIAETKASVEHISLKLDEFIRAHDTKNTEQKKEFDARYASKRIETAFWGAAAFLGIA